jgi:tritrans,polycis-undecaprenyl-diphosphate synthase [geranylgeranyl-diphosphate specific]
MSSKEKKYPKHIGIILDGNRRFAKRLMKEPWRGHELGAAKISKLFEWCKDLDVKELTLYAFSMQNFNRPKLEFEYLMRLFLKFFSNEEYLSKLHENKIKINFIGRIHLFPKEIYERMLALVDETKDYSDYVINFAMAYGGREEIVDAVGKICSDVKDGKVSCDSIDIEKFTKYMQLQSDPDLIIRTGGDRRTSNFLMWQSWYSEWFFLEKFWPEFEKEDFIGVIDEFMGRERRFGK